MIDIKVPARVCFFGDHQDYLGLPVIAGTINRYLNFLAEPIDKAHFELNLKDINTQRIIDFSQNQQCIQKDDFLAAAILLLARKGWKPVKGYRVTISGDIPINAGLSSSSALVVGWLRTLLATQDNLQLSNVEIGQLAYETEVLFFNSPGGLMDQYTIAQGGLLYIDTETGTTQKLKGDLGCLIVAESGIAKKTNQVLKNARLYQERAVDSLREMNPSFELKNAKPADYKKHLSEVPKKYRKHWYAAVYNHHITQQAHHLLKEEKINSMQLATLINEHQKILEECIHNTPEEMAKMMAAAKKAGALGTKIIGSGGGGCMLALTDYSNKEKVIQAFLDSGVKNAYEVKLVNHEPNDQ